MGKWKYKIGRYIFDSSNGSFWVCDENDKLYRNVCDMLTALGEEGWELVAVSTFTNSQKTPTGREKYPETGEELFYFKQPA